MGLIGNNTVELHEVRFTDTFISLDRGMHLHWRLFGDEDKNAGFKQARDQLIGALRDWEEACPEASRALTAAICTKYIPENEGMIIVSEAIVERLSSFGFKTRGDFPDMDYDCPESFKKIGSIYFPEEYNTMISRFLSRRIESLFPCVEKSRMSSALFINDQSCPWDSHASYYMMNIDLEGSVSYDGNIYTNCLITSCNFWM